VLGNENEIEGMLRKEIEKKMGEERELKFVIQKTLYEDNNGRFVEERVVVSGEAPEGFVRFQGRGNVKGQFKHPLSPNTTVSADTKFSYPIDAETVWEAFEKTEDAFLEARPAQEAKLKAEVMGRLNKAVEAAKKQEEEAKNQTATAPPGILGPRGTLKGTLKGTPPTPKAARSSRKHRRKH